MEKSLKILVDNFQIHGLKCETEAEGSTFEDIWFLKILADQFSLPLHFKIAGCEAINDINKAYEIGVSTIIAPMVETPFACYKFLKAVEQVYGKKKINLTINVETKTALLKLKEIISLIKDSENEFFNTITNITIGRGDLSLSYFDKDITVNSDFIFEKVKEIIAISQQAGLTITMGGGVNKKTIDIVKNDESLRNGLKKIESRKVIFDHNSSSEIFHHIFNFEAGFLKHKKDILNLHLKDVDKRTDLLRVRYGL